MWEIRAVGMCERDAGKRVAFRLRVSEPEPLSFQKSAKIRDKNPNSLRRDCGFLSLTQIPES